MPIISTKNLHKDYTARNFAEKKITALSNFTFDVDNREIFGILGPNGAGKTTLIKILLGITFPTSGEVKVFDKHISDVSYKRKVGYLPENHKFPNYLTGEQVLHYFGKLSGLTGAEVKKKADEYLNLTGMEKWRKTKIKKYSKGMMQRLGLAQSLLNNPEIVFLDEPTDGVDPIGRKEIRDLLKSLKERGSTIFLNSHMLSEVELVCDRIAILNKGILVKSGRVDEITALSNNYIFHTSEIGESVLNALLLEYKAVIKSNGEFQFNAKSEKELNELIDYLRVNKIYIHGITREKDTLENMFISIIGSGN